MKKSIFCLIILAFILLSAVTKIEAVEVSAFEQTYFRNTGAPVTETKTFYKINGLATIRVTNGGLEDADYEMVSSSIIVLNGEVIIDSSNFNQNVGVIEVERNLSGGINTIEVTLKGKPGGALTVQVLAEAGDIDFDDDGFTGNEGDCNDDDNEINPNAQEVCDGVDNNCDGQTDEGVKTTFYHDVDSDGYGNPNDTTEACQQPSGYVTDNTDCNDNDANEHPNQTWYKDADNDGYSDGTTDTVSCVRPTGYKTATELTATSGDCEDSDAAVNPGTTEIPYNGKDDDCNTSTPDDDLDGDGYVNTNDCNDNDSSIHPGATETPYDGIDQDGDGSDLNDLDIDGYIAIQAGGNDCNDNDDTINPDAQEVCDGVDNNCDGQTDEPVIIFTSPVDDSTIDLSSILITGTINTCSQEVGIVVNGVLAMVAGNEFAVNDVPMEIGVNTLTAVATDEDGKTATDTITVYANVYQDQVNLSANITSGLSPLEVEFSIDTQTSNPINTYEMGFEGDGVIDLTIVDPDNVPFTYVQEGIYYPTITVTDDQGYQYTDTIAINVLSLNELNTLLTNKRSEVINLLILQDIQSTLPYFIESSRAKYEEAFTLFFDQLPDIFSVPEELNLISVIDNIATYENVVVDDDGVTRSYPSEFIKNDNGLWKMTTF